MHRYSAFINVRALTGAGTLVAGTRVLVEPEQLGGDTGSEGPHGHPSKATPRLQLELSFHKQTAAGLDPKGQIFGKTMQSPICLGSERRPLSGTAGGSARVHGFAPNNALLVQTAATHRVCNTSCSAPPVRDTPVLRAEMVKQNNLVSIIWTCSWIRASGFSWELCEQSRWLTAGTAGLSGARCRGKGTQGSDGPFSSVSSQVFARQSVFSETQPPEPGD